METFKNTLVTDSKRKSLLRASYFKYFPFRGFEVLQILRLDFQLMPYKTIQFVVKFVHHSIQTNKLPWVF